VSCIVRMFDGEKNVEDNGVACWRILSLIGPRMSMLS